MVQSKNLSDSACLEELRSQLREELTQNILPFWMERMPDQEQGGFYGRIDGHGICHPEAEKGTILCARILWTFSAAYRLLHEVRYLAIADRAKEYLLNRFIDPDYGGVYWSLKPDGTPSNTKKQVYASGFAIYGLSEYARATSDPQTLETAIALFHTLEQKAWDPLYGGYFEAFSREWGPIDDVRLSDKDANERKTMNTHLHILEPYTNLYRIWPSGELAKSIRRLITIFTEKIYDRQTGHLGLFFGDDWSRRSSTVSYGHDIESSWLIDEAVRVLGDEKEIVATTPIIKHIARAAAEGILPDGSLIYESDPKTGDKDTERHWWVQAENVVGFYNLFHRFADQTALDKALRSWEYIRTHLIDPTDGEWFWSILPNGQPNKTDDKAGFWKCPYHNGRMCMEIMARNSCDR